MIYENIINIKNLNIELSFDIYKPKLEFYKEINKNELVEFYVDGNLLKFDNNNLIFSSCGGYIKQKDEIIGFFYVPITINKKINNDNIFEECAINSAKNIIKIIDIKKYIIYNDSLFLVKKINSEKIKWISRDYNIADKIVSYAKEKYKKDFNYQLVNIIKLKYLFNNNTNNKILIIESHKKNESKLNCINEKGELILSQKIDLKKSVILNIFNFLNELIKLNLINDCSIILNKSNFLLFEKLVNQLEKYKEVEDFIEIFSNNFAIEQNSSELEKIQKIYNENNKKIKL